MTPLARLAAPSLLIAFGLLLSAEASAAETIYVAPDGNDAWTGTAAGPNAGKTDGPFATLGRAQRAARAARWKQGVDKPAEAVTIRVRGGTYAIDAPLVLTPEDSGTKDAPVTYAAFEGETPILSGGRRVVNWAKSTTSGRETWSGKLPPGVRTSVRSLWVNGQRRTRARLPNVGYLNVESLPTKKPGADWTVGVSAFTFKANDLKAWPSLADAEVVVMSRWVDSRLPQTGIDEAKRLATFGKSTVFELQDGDMYYAEGAADFLDAPGEWYVDRKSSTIHYLPLSGETITSFEATVPLLTQILRLEGKPAEGTYVEHVTLQGLTFAHAEFDPFGPDGKGPAGYAQAAIGVPAAVTGVGVRNAIFDRCHFRNVTTYGLELGRGCQSNAVTHCNFTDLGAGGVRVGETAIRDNLAEQAFGNVVSDCTIKDAGRTFHSGIGVWIGQSFDNRVSHCTIADQYYTAISVGWTWGYGKSLARGNVIEKNHVHHIGKRSDGDGPILSDMGALYTLGTQPGTVIRNNHFHDIDGVRYGGWGIYFDEGSTGIVAEGNLVYRTVHGGFHQHYGKDNLIRNNILALGRARQIERSRAEDHRSFTFERNIVYWTQGEGIVGNFGNFNVTFDHNLYYATDKATANFAYLPFEEWQKKGQDAHSFVADPLFVDPAKNDFRLKPSSPAEKIGFKPLDITDAGVRDKTN